MGSVPEGFQCSWCGRIGNGEYAPDSIGYPICCGGEHSCVGYQVRQLQLDIVGFRVRQLQTIFRGRGIWRYALQETWRGVAQFLILEDWEEYNCLEPLTKP